MASTINASTSAGLVSTADTSGVLQLQTAGTTALTISTAQLATLAGGLNFSTLDAGITFNKTSALTNSTLNDYEAGTWTPVLKFGSTTVTLSTAQGTYTKVGRQVTINMQVSWTSKSGTGAVTITGLPFSSASSPSTVVVPAGCNAGGLTTTAAIFYNIDGGTSILHLAQESGDITDTGVATSGSLFCSGTYFATS
jgi:hypothetical protein